MVNAALSLAGGLAASLTGAGNSKTLTKLRIKPLPPSQLKPFDVPFNPTSYSITKPVTWSQQAVSTNSTAAAGTTGTATRKALNAPMVEFGGGGSRILTLELFFDVTEPVLENGQPVTYEDVRELTNKIVKLTRIERKADPKQPPVCEISWGKAPSGSDFPFKGVVTNLVQNFTLFRSDGKPVRARLTVTFTEWINSEDDQKETDPEQTTRVVKRGDTLSSIASEVYGNAKLWRLIAEANRLDDPRYLEIGKPLLIPKLS